MNAWERRLKDLAHVLTNCAATYFEPENFRMNVNHFLQTSRTVTFIIQKNKASIPNFDTWYAANVDPKWRGDPIMEWAKESRNFVEKQGDLEINSTLNVALLFSYLPENDTVVGLASHELVDGSIKKLIRLARRHLPTGMTNAASVKIERRWVTASLPQWELLHALVNVYTQIYLCCEDLAAHLKKMMDPDIPNVNCFENMRNHARQVQYVKLRDAKARTIEIETHLVDRSFHPPAAFRTIFEANRIGDRSPETLKEVVAFFGNLAQKTFEHFGYHVPMLIFLTSGGNRSISCQQISRTVQTNTFFGGKSLIALQACELAASFGSRKLGCGRHPTQLNSRLTTFLSLAKPCTSWEWTKQGELSKLCGQFRARARSIRLR